MLHVDSWRRHYRGAYADSYLDGDVVADRREVWSDRLGSQDGAIATTVAEHDDALVGFIHVPFDADARWGALVDNLHVVKHLQRRGIGAQLLRAAAASVVARHEPTGLFLWVLEQNLAAQAFYDVLGGTPVESAAVQPLRGDPQTLVGSPRKLRYVWPDARELCEPRPDAG